MSVDILATSWDQRRSMVQCCFMSTEAVRLVRTESPGRPPRLSHISWTLSFEDVPLVEFMYLVFTRMPGESYRRQLRSLLLYLFRVFRALINSLVCWFRSLEGRLLVFSVLQLCKKYTRLRVQAHTHTHVSAPRERGWQADIDRLHLIFSNILLPFGIFLFIFLFFLIFLL